MKTKPKVYCPDQNVYDAKLLAVIDMYKMTLRATETYLRLSNEQLNERLDALEARINANEQLLPALLTGTEVQAALGISRQTLHELVKSGVLKKGPHLGRWVRYQYEDVNRLMEQGYEPIVKSGGGKAK